jgi:hypothetical protein
MHIWRVENDRGEGPYNIYKQPPTEQTESPVEGVDRAGEFEGVESALVDYPGPIAQLDPKEDFSTRSYNVLSRKGYPFGFKTAEHAINWFSEEGLEKLKEHGYHLKQVPARRVWAARAKVEPMNDLDETGQVFFEPWKKQS